MNQINRPIFLDSYRRRVRRVAALLAIAIGTAGIVASLFFSIGYLISS